MKTVRLKIIGSGFKKFNDMIIYIYNDIPMISKNKFLIFLVQDLMKIVIKTFNLLCEDEGVLQLYEREVSIEHNDVFHRLCQLDEKPLGSWRLLGLII